MKLQEFIANAMMSNPKSKVYWDDGEQHFMMEIYHGQHLTFGKNLSFKAQWDESNRAFYYTDKNNLRVYLLYLVYAD